MNALLFLEGGFYWHITIYLKKQHPLF